ncbi:MAG: cytochrome b [Gammaproteobacteria bacterium]|nr:cytochrome b [Gammaproteobacteria bacterium]
MLKNTSTEFGTLSKGLHWVMALVIFSLLAVGLYMAALDEKDPARLDIYNLHKSFGVLAMMLIVARIVWLKITPAPALPAVFDSRERIIIKGVQGLLYVVMLLLPVSGYVMSTAAGYSVPFFGLMDMPVLFSKNKEIAEFAHEMHELLGYTIILFIFLHVAGVIKHRLKDKGGDSDILKRML